MPSDVSLRDYAMGILRRFRDNGDGTVTEKYLQVGADGTPVYSTGGMGPSTKGTITDRSGTIAVGGAAQSLAPSNAARNYLLIQNPTTASASFWVDFAGVSAVRASPSVEVAPGVTLEWGGTFIPTGAISVNGNTGVAYTAKEG